jgi:hypothetical protein
MIDVVVVCYGVTALAWHGVAYGVGSYGVTWRSVAWLLAWRNMACADVVLAWRILYVRA